jgi:hypothetical protein
LAFGVRRSAFGVRTKLDSDSPLKVTNECWLIGDGQCPMTGGSFFSTVSPRHITPLVPGDSFRDGLPAPVSIELMSQSKSFDSNWCWGTSWELPLRYLSLTHRRPAKREARNGKRQTPTHCLGFSGFMLDVFGPGLIGVIGAAGVGIGAGPAN